MPAHARACVVMPARATPTTSHTHTCAQAVHGSDDYGLDNIAEYGFNRSYAGKNACSYGMYTRTRSHACTHIHTYRMKRSTEVREGQSERAERTRERWPVWQTNSLQSITIRSILSFPCTCMRMCVRPRASACARAQVALGEKITRRTTVCIRTMQLCAWSCVCTCLSSPASFVRAGQGVYFALEGNFAYSLQGQYAQARADGTQRYLCVLSNASAV